MKTKKTVFLVLMILGFSTCMFSGNNLSLSISGHYLMPVDSSYKDVYGSAKIFPEIKINSGPILFKNFSLWGSFGYLPANGIVPGTDAKTKSTQMFIALGGRYTQGFSPTFHVSLRWGVLYVSYKEEALDSTVKDSAVGFVTGVGFIYDINNTLFTEIEGAYMYASDKIPGTADFPESTTVKLGGLRFGIGLGIKF